MGREGVKWEMEELRSTHDAELTLTYVDEDADVVTLVDDEDLQDVMRQDLNPLRISVSPHRVQPPFPNLNSGVSDVLKTIPEPLRAPVVKVLSDLTIRASSSTPILAELVDAMSKMGLCYNQNQASGPQPVKEAGSHSGTSNGNTMSADGGKPNVKSGEPSLKKERLTALHDEKQPLKTTEPKPKASNEAVDATVKLISKSKTSEGDRTEAQSSSCNGPKAQTSLVKTIDGKTIGFAYVRPSPIPPEKPSDEQPSKGHPVAKPIDLGASASSNKLKQCNWDSRNTDPSGSSSGSSMKMPFRSVITIPLVPFNPVNECPFSGVPTVNNPVPIPNFPFEVPLKRSHNHSDGTGTIFHKGVRCDGCGVHPITGGQENYDLCSICFAEMGNDADYIRMDRPLAYQHPLSFKGLHDLQIQQQKRLQDMHARLCAPTVQQVPRGYGWKSGTQLVWIEGDRLSDKFSVELEITTAGLAVGQELDVAVDFTAPEHPGRYISYWRLASSSGKKFGQRVWVLIQVDAVLNQPKQELVHEAFQGLNLNLPPASSDVSGPDIFNVNPEPQNVLPELKSSSKMELVDSVAEVSQNKEQDAKFLINDSLLVGVGDKLSSPSAPGSPISYPIIDLTEEAPVVSSMAPSAAVAMQAPLQDVDLNKEILRKNEYDLEQSVDELCGVAEWDPLLEELEEMGFSNKEMNKKLLEKNNGGIKGVVMDLIAGEQ
ncbi:hypothetical protein RND71_029889 [Anisodus tanguticus]|uniref:Uncharacterized protein n=1 Tax=Anisodus tanguticus TaxID=243964 RepID=A0AAE1V4Z6_9SOLA|nr:hypothetical protein RND71_029889 [Anisodus tanguticus]